MLICNMIVLYETARYGWAKFGPVAVPTAAGAGHRQPLCSAARILPRQGRWRTGNPQVLDTPQGGGEVLII